MAALALALLLGAPARATRLSLGIGQAKPTSVYQFDVVAGPGPAISLEYVAGDEWLGLGFQFNAFAFGRKSYSLDVAAVDARSSALSLDAIVRFTPLYSLEWGPYLFGGGGGNRFRLTQDGTPAPGYVWKDTGTTEKRTVRDATSTGFSYVWGGGFEARITESGLNLAVEGRCDTFMLQKSKFAGVAKTESCGVLGRIGFRFD